MNKEKESFVLPTKELKEDTPAVFVSIEEKDEKDIDFCNEGIMSMAFKAAFADKV